MSEDNDIEHTQFLQSILDRYGYDFTGYSEASLRRRISFARERRGFKTIAALLDMLLREPALFREFLSDITVNVTEMFRDPDVYAYIRQQIVPVLRTYPSVKIWHAGCASGEEVYSMAILFKEEGLYEKTLFYGTDISPRAIDRAKEGIYPAANLKEYTANYYKAGGKEAFSTYYTSGYGSVKILSSLQKNIVFSLHNLVIDEVFSEAHLILCRNVLIYFDRELQSRVLELLSRSLTRRGYLCLGSKESLEFSDIIDNFEAVCKKSRIYRKL